MFLAAWLALAPAPVAERPAADIVGVELQWQAPAECPSADEVGARLGALLGDRSPSSPFVRIAATVTRAAGAFALHMRTETPSGINEHDLSSPDCRALADGAALVAAVAADPLAVDRSLAAERTPDDGLPPDEVVVTPTPPSEDPPRPRGRLRLARFALRADGLLEYGMLPRLGFGPVVTLGLIGPLWRAELAAIYLAPRAHFTDSTRTAGAALGTWALRVRGCGVPVVRRLEFPLCAGFEGGQMTARPLGTTGTNRDDDRGFGLFSFGGAIGVSPRPFVALFAGVDGIVALTRPRFEAGGVPLHQPGRAGVRATVGLELRVP